MRLAELQGLASSMGISGTAKMRKGDLVAAIKSRQNGESGPVASSDAPSAASDAPSAAFHAPSAASDAPVRTRSRRASSSGQVTPKQETSSAPSQSEAPREDRGHRRDRAEEADASAQESSRENRSRSGRHDSDRTAQDRTAQDRSGSDRDGSDRTAQDGEARESRDRNGQQREAREPRERSTQDGDGREQRDRSAQQRDRSPQDRDGRSEQQRERNAEQRDGRHDRAQDHNGPGDDDDDESGRSGRRRRNRNRNRDRDRDKRRVSPGGETQHENESQQITEDDVLVPVAGILDILDNYAFVRTSGYLPGNHDVYVPLGMVKRHNLRKGDAVVGATKAPRDGEEPQQQSVGTRNNRQKYTPLARLDSINGMSSDDALKRVEFGKLTPLYPQDRLRLETEPGILTTRIIDLVAPIGKGQRGLIVAPAKAGKTMVMQAIANAITTNNPEVHLMVVLVDERPEEVTDMQRAVKGEVIASTFDRPAEDHTTVAELAIERAKRLVEMGHDVVVLLDSITKLGRAYNLAAPASGRILSGGVDSAALYPPKKFFGAARNIEDGGSLTILATALVETGSRMDEVIFEEFKGTGNMELKLDRGLSNRRIFPAVDINNSGTRREEILLAPDELKIMWKLRRVLAALDSQQGIELLLDRLRKTKTNYEFLVQVQQTSSAKLEAEDS
ncbi:transcription termination factor Rho [Knoellia sp. Soil729]|nr:transcription termination factor Rho [Knoellia sp. Soil729]